MQGLITSSVKLIMFVLLLLGMSGVAHSRRRRLVSSYDAPCNRMTVYYHDILYNGENHANATSSAITQPTELSRSTYFGELVVFDDVVTAEQALSSEPVARAQGFYFYDKKGGFSSWFAFSLVFNSTAYRGTLELVGADVSVDKIRDISVIGGTGDFFMARGIATVSTDSYDGMYYFRLKMDVKLYECYV
ncbi:hypothetical protein PR202_ga26468 [Eleusine coracana subsp. coracana]|uniref:Dirigent protein n=1 Tax=Eleusine coracana subsp. coracana TaxID=191504 RepID=A0AAV5DC08_ELECO|nr:hypothetical protein QOZ80_3AG0240100 [Eleusine coracana subsp. coracana]GJN08534.1 hypothetical protein PR202_ga26468 [Eleusine coracana subsp. coracana]